MDNYDIVYFVNNGTEPIDELTYSLRSVEQNFPHRKVIIVGGCPENITPDLHIPLVQDKKTKWGNVCYMVREVCKNNDISKRFFLFNDDFFILKPVTSWPANYFDGTLADWIKSVRSRNARSEYADRLVQLEKSLKNTFYPTYNFATHVPILVNRAKMAEVLRKYPETAMLRALYGNYVFMQEGGIPLRDYKIVSLDKKIREGATFVSTHENSFEKGEVGKQIRAMFKKKSRFEKGGNIGKPARRDRQKGDGNISERKRNTEGGI